MPAGVRARAGTTAAARYNDTMTTSARTPLGVTLVDGGANVALFSSTAERVEFCTFDDDGTEHRTELQHRTGYTFHDIVPGVAVGTRYGFRVHGAWDPAKGLRHNGAKLLLDPYATAVDGSYEWGQALFGHDMDDPETRDDTDSAAAMPKSVVADRSFDWGDDVRPATPLGDTVFYEVHVKGYTQRHPEVREDLRGTYAGLASEAAIAHLVPDVASREVYLCGAPGWTDAVVAALRALGVPDDAVHRESFEL